MDSGHPFFFCAFLAPSFPRENRKAQRGKSRKPDAERAVGARPGAGARDGFVNVSSYDTLRLFLNNSVVQSRAFDLQSRPFDLLVFHNSVVHFGPYSVMATKGDRLLVPGPLGN